MTLVEWRIKWESGVFVWHDVCIQEFSVFRFGGGEGGRAPTKSDLNLVQLTLSRKRSTPRSLAPSLSSDANVSKGSNYSRPALNDLWDHLYIGFGLVRNVQFNNATVKNVPSRRMPTFRHFLRRQYWHWLRWCWSIGHDLKLVLFSNEVKKPNYLLPRHV